MMRSPGRKGKQAKISKKSLFNLLKLLKPFYKFLIIAVLTSTISVVIAIIAPSYLGKLVDTLTQGIKAMATSTGRIDLNRITLFGFILAGMYLVNVAFSSVSNVIMALLNKKITLKLRDEIGRKVNKVPLNYYDTHETGDILSRITNDVDTLADSLNNSVLTIISSVIMLTGVIIAMFLTSWQLALVCLAVIPISILLIVLIMGLSQKFFVRQSSILGSLTGTAEEAYSGFSVIKLFNQEDKQITKFSRINNNLAKNSMSANFVSGLMMPLMNFVSTIAIIAVSIVGGLLLIDELVTFGVISSFLVYVRLFQNPLINISQSMNYLQRCLASTDRIYEFLEIQEVSDESNKPPFGKHVNGEVIFEHVKFGYLPNTPVIKDFSIVVKPGQTVAIVGPTGAGKTTLINLLMRFYEIDSGDIKIDGVSINSISRQEVRKLFSMVLQDTWLFEGTIRDNLRYNNTSLTDIEIETACKVVNLHHYIETLPNGFDFVIGEESQISTGQKQLLTIARAVLQNHPMLILDEATSNVDTRTEQMIQDAMDKLTYGRTSFVIAHRLSTIKNADIILVLKEGDIIESGTHQQLLDQNGFYAKLYNSQFQNESQMGLVTVEE